MKNIIKVGLTVLITSYGLTSHANNADRQACVDTLLKAKKEIEIANGENNFASMATGGIVSTAITIFYLAKTNKGLDGSSFALGILGSLAGSAIADRIYNKSTEDIDQMYQLIKDASLGTGIHLTEFQLKLSEAGVYISQERLAKMINELDNVGLVCISSDTSMYQELFQYFVNLSKLKAI